MKQECYNKNTFFVTHSNQLPIKTDLQKENVNTFNCTVACYHYHPTYNIICIRRNKIKLASQISAVDDQVKITFILPTLRPTYS